MWLFFWVLLKIFNLVLVSFFGDRGLVGVVGSNGIYWLELLGFKCVV